MYDEVLIPAAVEKEFLQNSKKTSYELTQRFEFLMNQLNINDSWLKRCNEYEEGLIKIYQSFDSQMGEGEAETMAQNQTLDSNYEVIIDERFATTFARNRNMTVHGTLYLIAVLGLKFSVCNYFEYTLKMLNETSTHISEKVIKMVF
jgi:predicted nucleic acid-binding protein